MPALVGAPERPQHAGVKYIHCVPATRGVRAKTEGETRGGGRAVLRLCEWINTLQLTCTQTQTHARTLQGVCILTGDYGDKNRGDFSADLESQCCDEDTMEKRLATPTPTTHTLWKHNLLQYPLQTENCYLVRSQLFSNHVPEKQTCKSSLALKVTAGRGYRHSRATYGPQRF